MHATTDTPAATARRLTGLPLRTVAEETRRRGCPLAIWTLSRLERGLAPMTAERSAVLRAIYLEAVRNGKFSPEIRAAVRREVRAMKGDSK